MIKILAIGVLAVALGGCAVASVAGDVVGAGVSVATTTVSTAAGSVVSSDKPKD